MYERRDCLVMKMLNDGAAASDRRDRRNELTELYIMLLEAYCCHYQSSTAFIAPADLF